jgi:hypothetical protein
MLNLSHFQPLVSQSYRRKLTFPIYQWILKRGMVSLKICFEVLFSDKYSATDGSGLQHCSGFNSIQDGNVRYSLYKRSKRVGNSNDLNHHMK